MVRLSGGALSRGGYSPRTKLRCHHLISALNAQFPDLTTVRSFHKQATWVIDVLGLFSYMLSMGLYTTRHCITSGRFVEELNVYILYIDPPESCGVCYTLAPTRLRLITPRVYQIHPSFLVVYLLLKPHLH